ncbi:N-acetylmuramoyl-L-alanine amidase [bacterium]|nr:N-acetylmuramoyl-L-alanine amidase [bacterium]
MIIIFSLFSFNSAQAEALLKINSINFDNSDSIIFLGTSQTEELTDFNITKQQLTSPNRVFFDINNAVLTIPNSTYQLKNSKLSSVRIAQFSTNPNVVRVVINYNDTYDISKIKLNTINNNLFIKLDDTIPAQAYLTQVYRESKESPYDYNEKTSVVENVIAPVPKPQDEIFNQVRSAFNESQGTLVLPNIEQKQARLMSRYFINRFEVRQGNILINGIGVVNLEAPIILEEPRRIVFDIPNTIVAQELRNKEIKINEYESVKLGQFEPSKARLVISTNFPMKYKPIYSFDLQSILFANEDKIKGLIFADKNSQITYYKASQISDATKMINIMFSNPVVYSLKRYNNELELRFYNLENFNVISFNQQAIENQQEDISAVKVGQNEYVIKFKLSDNMKLDCYETLNATQIRLNITGSAKSVKPQKPKEESKIKIGLGKKDKDSSKIPSSVLKKTIILDAGHGGKDTGAIKSGINEKDITLEMILRLKDELEDRGFSRVYLTRDDDTYLTLAERVEFASEHGADAFVSIHLNSSVKPDVRGFETHYYTDEGYGMAKVIHSELSSQLVDYDRGLFKSKFYVINHTIAPSILLEVAFLSNDEERREIMTKEKQEQIIKAIADGLVRYLRASE